MSFTAPKTDNKNFINFEHHEEEAMYKWIEENLRKMWEINIERFPGGAVIVKFRWHNEAEQEFRSGNKKKTLEEDDL